MFRVRPAVLVIVIDAGLGTVAGVRLGRGVAAGESGVFIVELVEVVGVLGARGVVVVRPGLGGVVAVSEADILERG